MKATWPRALLWWEKARSLSFYPVAFTTVSHAALAIPKVLPKLPGKEGEQREIRLTEPPVDHQLPPKWECEEPEWPLQSEYLQDTQTGLGV